MEPMGLPYPESRRLLCRGFTLIELLAAIAIIAVLVSLLLPSLAKGRAAAQHVSCLSNLHQIGLAIQMYAEDFEGRIPRGNNVVWFLAYMPYIPEGGTARDFRNVNIYRCPSYPNKGQVVCYVDSSWSFHNSGDNIGFEIHDPTPLGNFRRPSETIYMADNEDGHWRGIVTGLGDVDISRHDVWHPSHLPSSTQTDPTYGRRISNKRHNGGSNVLYYGGNADWMKADQMTVDMWREIWK